MNGGLHTSIKFWQSHQWSIRNQIILWKKWQFVFTNFSTTKWTFKNKN